MKNNKYRILVLSDLKGATDNILKSTISLSKMVNGDIEFFHVKKPTDIVDRENQLSAMRTINKEHVLMDNKLQSLLESVAKDYKVKINHKFTFGNVKSEINKRIKDYKPDIIVLGKKKSKALSFIGDNVTDFIFKNHHGTIMIANGNALDPNKELSLGVLNNPEQLNDIEFAENLLSNTSKPLKCFKIIDKADNLEEKPISSKEKMIEYTFEKGDNSIKSLSKYLTKSDVNLLCLDRGEKPVNDKSISLNSEMKKVINNVDVSLLFSNRK